MSGAMMEAFDARASVHPALDRVRTEPAPDAGVCGAIGCQNTTRLVRGIIEGFGERVLCAEHMADLVRREVHDE
jgi:hypothetical protein